MKMEIRMDDESEKWHKVRDIIKPMGNLRRNNFNTGRLAALSKKSIQEMRIIQ